MKRRNFCIALLAIVTLFNFSSCNKTDDDDLIESNGLSVDINSFMPQSILDKIDSLGMPIYTGGNPANIMGTFLLSPDVLYSSNIEGDNIGKSYNDVKLNFSSQDNIALTVDLRKSQGSQEGESNASFIVGNGDTFSVFTQIKMYDEENKDSSLIAQVYSGTIAENGIINCFGCIVMLNDFGDPNDLYIEVGDVWVFYDEDGLSEHADELKLILISNDLVGCCENTQNEKLRKQ